MLTFNCLCFTPFLFHHTYWYMVRSMKYYYLICKPYLCLTNFLDQVLHSESKLGTILSCLISAASFHRKQLLSTTLCSQHWYFLRVQASYLEESPSFACDPHSGCAPGQQGHARDAVLLPGHESGARQCGSSGGMGQILPLEEAFPLLCHYFVIHKYLVWRFFGMVNTPQMSQIGFSLFIVLAWWLPSVAALNPLFPPHLLLAFYS